MNLENNQWVSIRLGSISARIDRTYSGCITGFNEKIFEKNAYKAIKENFKKNRKGA